MSRVRQTKIAAPSSPPASTEELYYDTAGPGYLTPAALCSKDENGVIAMLAHFTILDYRLLKVTVITASGTWTPTAGCRAAYVECIGGGGQGGGAATSSTQVSVGSGGGAGAYAASWITGVTATVSVTVGAGGSSGGAGAVGTVGSDTIWGSNVIVAKGGSGGTVMAAGTTLITADGVAGGLEASCTGDLKCGGGDGAGPSRLGSGANQGIGGNGGNSAMGNGGFGRTAATGGLAGTAGHTYGGGGGGAGTQSTAAAGGAGATGVIRVHEFA